MSPPTWVVGQVLTASDVNTWLVPKAVVKPSAEHRSNTTALTNDTALSLAVDANATYQWICYIMFSAAGPGTGDIKISFTFPASSTCAAQINTTNPAGVSLEGAAFTNGTGLPVASSGNGSGVFRSIGIVGSLTSTTAGTLQFLFGQQTANAVTDTIVYAGSFMTLQRIG